MKYYIDKDTKFTPQQLYNYVEDFKSSQEYIRLINLEKYYRGKNTTISNRPKSLNDDINNKLISGFPRYITNMAVGYFVGGENSINYIFPNKNEEIENNFKYNDEKAVTVNLAKNASIYGYSIEQYFVDDKGNFRFKEIDPKNVILFFQDNVDEDLVAVIKFREYTYKKANGYEEVKLIIEYYNEETYEEYTYIDDNHKNELDVVEVNVFSDVPFTYYENPDRLSDFENVISLIDAYDAAISDNANLFNYYNDAYLIFKGCEIDENIRLKEMRGLNIPEGGDVFYLQKPEVCGDLINYTETLRKDIHKFSMVPDLSDKDFLQAQSGISMRLKLQGLEFLTGVKESNFRKGLTRRLELLGNFLSLSNNDFSFEKCLITFKRNTVESVEEIINNAIKIKDIVSTETLLEWLPGIDPKDELKKLKKEKEENIMEFQLNTQANQFFPKEEEEVDNNEQ